jgi:hypothetical protein
MLTASHYASQVPSHRIAHGSNTGFGCDYKERTSGWFLLAIHQLFIINQAACVAARPIISIPADGHLPRYCEIRRPYPMARNLTVSFGTQPKAMSMSAGRL